LPWIGTGRFIFSHNYSDEEFETVIKRMVAAGIAMQHAGWWWQAPALTNKSIKRDVLRELVKTKLSAKSKLANLS
ncbi:hypothetical protein, partial [Oleiphilus sp. HI0066]